MRWLKQGPPLDQITEPRARPSSSRHRSGWCCFAHSSTSYNTREQGGSFPVVGIARSSCPSWCWGNNYPYLFPRGYSLATSRLPRASNAHLPGEQTDCALCSGKKRTVSLQFPCVSSTFRSDAVCAPEDISRVETFLIFPRERNATIPSPIVTEESFVNSVPFSVLSARIPR